MQKVAYFDVTALIELLKGGKNILTMVETYQDFFTGSIIAASVMGAETYLIEKKVLKSKRIVGLLNSMKIIDFTEGDAEKAGELMGKLKATGSDISFEEAAIISQCTRKGLTLITKRKSFKKFRKIVGVDIQEI